MATMECEGIVRLMSDNTCNDEPSAVLNHLLTPRTAMAPVSVGTVLDATAVFMSGAFDRRFGGEGGIAQAHAAARVLPQGAVFMQLAQGTRDRLEIIFGELFGQL